MADIDEEQLKEILDGHIHASAAFMWKLVEGAIQRQLTYEERQYIEKICQEICDGDITMIESPADYQMDNTKMAAQTESLIPLLRIV